jgi:hypothetical protein
MKFAFNLDRQFVQDGQFNYESQTAYIGFNYRFNSKKNKGKQLKKRDDNIKGGRWFLVDKISAYLYL